MPQSPGEHLAPPGAAPATVHYEGGGIFAAQTPGPALNNEPADDQARGSDFGPPGFDMSGPPPPFLSMSPAPMPMPISAAPPRGTGPMNPPYFVGPEMYGPDGYPIMPGSMAPMGAMPQEYGHMLGLSLIGVALGAAVGTYYGGVYGGLAGSLFGGAALNAYRAFSYFKEGTEDADKEAKVSGTYALGASALGAVIWHQLVHQKGIKGARANRKKEEDDSDDGDDAGDEDDYVDNSEKCPIRPVGP